MIIEPEVLERCFAVSPDELWQRLSHALTTVPGATLVSTDEARKEARFVTGVTSFSWGENMIAKVEPSDGGGARLRITGQVRHTILSSRFGERIHRSGFTRDLMKVLAL